MITSPHLYFDATFIQPKDFSQLLVVLYYDNEINKKCPGAYILLNNKYESSYYKALLNFKNILTLENFVELEMISYTTDFDLALSNSLEKVFPKIKQYGAKFIIVSI